MKIKHVLIMALASNLSFTACKSDKKEKEMNATEEMSTKDSSTDNMEADSEMESNQMQNQQNQNTDAANMTLAEVAMASQDHRTLVSAVQGAGYTAKLKTDGPFTIFAPTNDAFNKLPKGTVEELMKPANKEKLEAVLSYHIVPGNLNASKLKELIKTNDNSYELVTANDGKLEAMIDGNGDVILTDATGKKAKVIAADMVGSNGVIHSVDAVLMRKK